MGGKFTRAIEIAHQRHFAERERLWEQPPPEFAQAPRAIALFFEMLCDDWRSRVDNSLFWLHRGLERVQSGEASEELR